MRFVSPNTGAKEIVLAKDQPQYQQLPVALYQNSQYPGAVEMVCRVQLSDEERALVFGGQDIFISQLVYDVQGKGRYHPIQVSVGEGQFTVPKELSDEEGG